MARKSTMEACPFGASPSRPEDAAKYLRAVATALRSG